MKLRAKILLLLLGAIIPVMLFFAGLGIYFFNNSLKQEAVKSHKLMYSLFLPTLSTYLWEFDTDGVRATISNIMKNNYAAEIYVYDMDGSLILGYVKNSEKNTIAEVKEENVSEFKFSTKKMEKFLSAKQNGEKVDLVEFDNSKSNSTVVGILYHKKIDGNISDPIGYSVFTYSNKEIEKLIAKAIISIVVISIFITLILVVLISILLRKALIEHIILLSNASLVIAMGKKKTVKEKIGHDEVAELIRNFNNMAEQIDQNQENLRLIAEEGIKVSSCLTIEAMVTQIRESINKISHYTADFDFYISSKLLGNTKKNGFLKIILSNESINFDTTDVISFGQENIIPQGVRRTFIRDNVYGVISAIIETKSSIGNENQMYFKKEEKLYSSIQALQVSAASALSTMNFIHEQKEQLRLVNEQETARLVQMNLLPTSDLKRILNFEIIGHFEPAAECAGDWWNTYQLPENKLLILLGDVTGHGTGSAILTAVVKGYCDSLCRLPNISTKDILLQLDKIVLNIGRGERVMTMFAGILDPIAGTIEFSNASHNFPFVVKNSSNSKCISRLIANGKPLGFNTNENENSKFITKVTSFEVNDLLFIFSDGLIEATNKDGVEFSDKTLKKILEQAKNKSVIEIKDIILNAFREFTYSTSLADDITFVVCKFVGL